MRTDVITFFTVFQKLCLFSAIIFIGMVESRETSESEPSNLCAMIIRIKPQETMPSSFKIEDWSISLFCLSCLRALPDIHRGASQAKEGRKTKKGIYWRQLIVIA